MHFITSITSKGQVTIPRHVRRDLNITAGDKVYVQSYSAEKQEISLKVVPQQSLEQLYGALEQKQADYIPIEKARDIAHKALAKKSIPKA